MYNKIIHSIIHNKNWTIYLLLLYNIGIYNIKYNRIWTIHLMQLYNNAIYNIKYKRIWTLYFILMHNKANPNTQDTHIALSLNQNTARDKSITANYHCWTSVFTVLVSLKQAWLSYSGDIRNMMWPTNT